MQSSEIVLYNLSKQAMKDGFQFDRLYRHLYNEDFYIKAYTKIYKNPENRENTPTPKRNPAISLHREQG